MSFDQKFVKKERLASILPIQTQFSIYFTLIFKNFWPIPCSENTKYCHFYADFAARAFMSAIFFAQVPKHLLKSAVKRLGLSTNGQNRFFPPEKISRWNIDVMTLHFCTCHFQHFCFHKIKRLTLLKSFTKMNKFCLLFSASASRDILFINKSRNLFDTYIRSSGTLGHVTSYFSIAGKKRCQKH